MTATLISSAARIVRAPLQAATRRQFSAATSSSASTASSFTAPVVGHSNQRLAAASAISAVAGMDVTYAYFTWFRKESSSA